MTPNTYEIVAEVNGLKFEVVTLGKRGLYQACTFGLETVQTPVRRTLGTFTTKAEAEAKARASAKAEAQP